MIKTSPRWSKKRLAIVLSVLATACSPIAAKAQAPPWSSPEQIGSGLFYGMAAGGKSVHVVNGNGTVYYHRSTTEGQSWEPAVPLGSGSVYLDRPLYADGQNLYLVYFKHVRDFTDSCCGRETGDLYMRRSTDNGSSWLPEIRLTNSGYVYRVATAIRGSNVYVTWMKYRPGANTWDTILRRSKDSGNSWLPEQIIARGDPNFGAGRPDILANGDQVFVAYNDSKGVQSCLPIVFKSLCAEVYLRRSRDGGESWDPAVRVTHNNAWSGRPMLAQTDDALLVGWEQTISPENGRNYIWISRSKDGGTNWEPPQKLSDTPGSHEWLVAKDRHVWIAWHGTGDTSNQQIAVRESEDSGATWGPEVRVSPPGGALVAMLGLTDRYVQMVWFNGRDPAHARRLISGPSAKPPVAEPPQPPPVAPARACRKFCVDGSFGLTVDFALRFGGTS